MRKNKNNDPGTSKNPRIRGALGKLVTKEAVKGDPIMRAAAKASRALEPGEQEGFWIGERQIAATQKTRDGRSRVLNAVLFMGGESLGVVSEFDHNKKAFTKLMLTKIGQGQRSGSVLAALDIEALLKPRPELGNVIQPWTDLTIGRGLENDIVLKDGAVSRKHASIRVMNNQVDATDEHSLNGTRYFTPDQIYGDNADQALVALWQEMDSNPALWSGEYDGATVVPQQ